MIWPKQMTLVWACMWWWGKFMKRGKQYRKVKKSCEVANIKSLN